MRRTGLEVDACLIFSLFFVLSGEICKIKPEFSYAASLQPNPSAVLKTQVTTSHLTVKPAIV